MPVEWKSGRIINPDQVRTFVEQASSASDIIRIVSQFLDTLADYTGPAQNVLSLLSARSPTVGFLNSAASLLQSLINDLLNQGVYAIWHHNFQDIIDQIGIYNAISEDARKPLPPVATELEAVEGANSEMVRDDQVEGGGKVGFEDAPFDGQSWEEVRGYQGWIRDIIKAFSDVKDPRRPILDTNGGLGGVVFLTGADSFASLQPLMESLSDVFDVAAFREFAAGLEEWEGIDLENLARLQSAAMFSTVRDTAYTAYGEKPDFYSKKVKDLFPKLGSVVVKFDALLDLLQQADVVGSQISDLIRAIELKLRQLSKVFEELAEIVDTINRILVDLPPVYALWLPVESGGVPHLQARIEQAISRPDFGPGSFLVGGGVFVTTPGAYNLIASLLFPDDADLPVEPLFRFSPQAGLEGIDSPEFVISPTDWPAWIATAGRSEVGTGSADGVLNTTDFDNSSSRGAPSPESHLQDDGSETGTLYGDSGGSRRSARRTESGTVSDTAGLGSRVGGLLLQRESWGTYTSELTRFSLGHDSATGGSAVSDIGTDILYVAHVAYDTQRLEHIYSTTDPMPSGLLIEGSATNRFPHSDRFSSATAASSATTEIIENAAPSADLLRRLEEAGPAVRLTVPEDNISVVASQLRATPTHSGCALSNIFEPDGDAFDVTSVNVGDWILGYQEVDLFGEFQDSFFIVQIDSIDATKGMLYFSPAIFTEPVARQLLLSDLLIVDGPFSSHLEQTGLPFDAGTYVDTFSVFARSEEWGDNDKGISIQYLGDTKGPAYSAQQSLVLPELHALSPVTGGIFDFNDGVLSAQAIGTSIDIGSIVEVRVSGESGIETWHFFVSSYVEDTQLDLALEPATSDGHLFDDDSNVVDARILDGSGTYQGYQRVRLEVPRQHTERTALIPGPSSSNSLLTLSHTDASNISGWIVTPGDVLVPVNYNASLTGISFRLANVGDVLPGRIAIEVSDDLKAAYAGRIFQVTYTTSYTSGSVRVLPWVVAPESGIVWSSPPSGTVRLWRAQWESGPMSSSIPTAESARTRDLDLVTYPSTKSAIPGSGQARITCTFYPSYRSAILEDNEILTILSGTGHVTDVFTLAIVGSGGQATIRMIVGGSVRDSFAFDYDQDDKIEIEVYFTYGDTDVFFSVTKNGTSLGADVPTSGFSIPDIDPLVPPGAKIYVGSDGSGGAACFGRVAELTIEDTLP